MAKKGRARDQAEAASPKRLRRRLEKIEARLTGAQDKRDRAQARVDALTILADEVRASIAAADAPPGRADEREAPTPRASTRATAPASTRASAPASAPSAAGSATRSRATGGTRSSRAGSSRGSRGATPMRTRATRKASTSPRRRRGASGGGAAAPGEGPAS